MAKLKLAERPQLIVGVDPAIKRSGWAVGTYAGVLGYGAVQGIEHVGDAVEAIASAYDKHAEVYGLVHCFVEYPVWGGPRIIATRAAANTWIRALRAGFPRGRVKVHKVAPHEWQSHYGLVRVPKGEMVPAYQRFASSLLGCPVEKDEAAAYLIMRYGATIARTESRIGKAGAA